MKKQIFLLSLLIAGPNLSLAESSCCSSSSASSCSSSCGSSSCDDNCSLDHGMTYRRNENTFQNATPVFVNMFNTNVIRDLEQDDKHGGLEITVFGGKNTKHAESAAYYFPYGHQHYTFDGSVSPVTFAHNIAWRQAIVGGTAAAAGSFEMTTDYTNGTWDTSDTGTTAAITENQFNADPTTYQFDPNKDTSKILPWNFGITYAALFEPLGASAIGERTGTGLVSNPAFKSTIDPKYLFSNVGAGIALRYHFSDDKQGLWGRISTSVEYVKSKICLNEKVQTKKTDLTNEEFPAQSARMGSVTTGANEKADNPYGLSEAQLNAGVPASTEFENKYHTITPHYAITLASPVAFDQVDAMTTSAVYTAPVDPYGSINEAYLNGTTGTYFPVNEEVTNGSSNAPANVEEAFNQSAWKYGKIGCAQSTTRLADIELCLGYQWLCSDCASTDWYVGMVIPTGNKPCATYVAPAVVGNGQHFGLMTGGSFELMLSENENRCVWYRVDFNGRYLFQNTQKRSFDLQGNEWSRYMMVWENKDAYSTALDYVNTNNLMFTDSSGEVAYAGQANRNYTPGINVFTEDMKVTPRLQSRINQAVYFRSECFRGELGWNMYARSKECVKFACDWDKAPAFADSSYIAGVGLNNNRTIYNDSQNTVVNATANLLKSTEYNHPGTTGNVLNLAAQTINSDDNKALYSQFAITEDQVNLDSAATPSSVTYTPYASLGYAWSGDCKPAVSVGGEYAFSLGNRALNKWMVWGKFEFAF